MPRMTPGMTSGAIMRKYRTPLNRKFSCSKRNAAQVPRNVEITVTATATRNDVARLRRFVSSWKIPYFWGPSPKNQSSVNPSQGSDGYIELLKARIIVTTSGAKRMTKYVKMNR